MRSREQVYDYIIVGAGSAGCVLANRLSANPDIRVLLLESGPAHQSWRLDMPLGFVTLLGTSRFNWNYETGPEAHLDARRLNCPAGRVLGGSSAINGMLHVRGNDRDFDAWRDAGCNGWSAEEVLPYFERSETFLGETHARRGRHGPLRVAPSRHRQPLDEAFLEAGDALHYPSTMDFNGDQQEGFGCYDRTIDDGVRFSVARGYCAPIRDRPNLTLRSRATVACIEFNGTAAVAVDVELQAQRVRVRAEREVLLCAGAIGSPTLLQRSGVGDPQRLREAHISCLHSLRAVGEGLQNHVEAVVQYRCKKPVSVHRQTLGARRYLSGARWFVNRSGICATNHMETGAFLTSSHANYPDLQLIFSPISLEHGTLEPTKWYGFQIHAGFQKPSSRGWVRCRNADASQPPELQLNFFSNTDDRARLAEAVEVSRAIAKSTPFAAYRGAETLPGAEVKTPRDIQQWLIGHAENSFHLSSSCRMGQPTDSACVVDPSCRVIGLDGLRVVDASIMPEVINANTNAAVVMMAEKAADMILQI